MSLATAELGLRLGRRGAATAAAPWTEAVGCGGRASELALCRWGDLLAGWRDGDGGRSLRFCRRCCDIREGALAKRAAAPRLWAD